MSCYEKPFSHPFRGERFWLPPVDHCRRRADTASQISVRALFPLSNALERVQDEYRCTAPTFATPMGGIPQVPSEIVRPWDSHTDRPSRLMDSCAHRQVHGVGILHRRSLIWKSFQGGPDAGALRQCWRGPRVAGPRCATCSYDKQHEGLVAGGLVKRSPTSRWSRWKIPDQDVSHQFPDFVFTVTRDFVRPWASTPVLTVPETTSLLILMLLSMEVAAMLAPTPR